MPVPVGEAEPGQTEMSSFGAQMQTTRAAAFCAR